MLEMVTLNLKSAETHNVSSSFVRELERNQKKKKKKKKKKNIHTSFVVHTNNRPV